MWSAALVFAYFFIQVENDRLVDLDEARCGDEVREDLNAATLELHNLVSLYLWSAKSSPSLESSLVIN